MSPEGYAAGLTFTPRPTDVVIAPFAKCGTTWLQQMVHSLRTGGDVDFDDISRVVPWIETAYDLGLDLDAPQRAEPRAYKSHLAWDVVPKGARYVVAVRDPRRRARLGLPVLRGLVLRTRHDLRRGARPGALPRGTRLLPPPGIVVGAPQRPRRAPARLRAHEAGPRVHGPARGRVHRGRRRRRPHRGGPRGVVARRDAGRRRQVRRPPHATAQRSRVRAAAVDREGQGGDRRGGSGPGGAEPGIPGGARRRLAGNGGRAVRARRLRGAARRARPRPAPPSERVLARSRTVPGPPRGREPMYIGLRRSSQELRDELRDYYAKLLTPEVEDELSHSEGVGPVARARSGSRWRPTAGLGIGWPQGVRRPGPHADRAVHLLRRVDARRCAGADAHDQLGRADDHAVRHRRSRRTSSCRRSSPARSTSASATPSPTPAPTSRRSRRGPCATATSTSSTARRSSPASRPTPTTSGSRCAPTRT